MVNQPPWLLELIAVLSASPALQESASFEVGFLVSGRPVGLSSPPVRATDGTTATAWIEGSSGTFEQIVSGTLTPQKAFLTDLLSFRGDPEVLLQVTALFEQCARGRSQ